jgi:hypothetical protein
MFLIKIGRYFTLHFHNELVTLQYYEFRCLFMKIKTSEYQQGNKVSDIAMWLNFVRRLVISLSAAKVELHVCRASQRRISVWYYWLL